MSWPDSPPPGFGPPDGSSGGWPEPVPPSSSVAWPDPITQPPPSPFPAHPPSTGAAQGLANPIDPELERGNQTNSTQNGILDRDGDLPATVQTSPLWLVIGLVLVIAAIVVFAVMRTATYGVIGWILGGPLAIGAVAIFLFADSRARQSPWFVGSDGLAWLRRVVIALALVAVALNAYLIAHDLARGIWT